MRQCKRCKEFKADSKFTKDKVCYKTTCKECRAALAKKKYQDRVTNHLCPLCGETAPMPSSCMCESCWFIRNGPRVAWIEQGKKCPYTGTALVPGHNMKWTNEMWVSKWYVLISRGLSREEAVKRIDAAHAHREVRIEPRKSQLVA